MKKTVSWSSDTLRRNSQIEKALQEADASETNNGDNNHDTDKPLTKSQSASINEGKKLTSPAVNSRIQQMIAMQKAQNATMQALLSTGGAGSASPSGLRDLVSTRDVVRRVNDGMVAPKEVRGVVEREIKQEQQQKEKVIVTMEPIKPPSISRGPAYTSTEHKETATASDKTIHYQGSTKPTTTYQSTLQPPDMTPSTTTAYTPAPSISYSTPDHLNPRLPRFSSDSSSCDSPVSYNSVLDHNSTPATVRERKRLQTIQSQEQMMNSEEYKEEFKIDPVPGIQSMTGIKEFNWESIGAAESAEFVPALPELSGGQRPQQQQPRQNGQQQQHQQQQIYGSVSQQQQVQQHQVYGAMSQQYQNVNQPQPVYGAIPTNNNFTAALDKSLNGQMTNNSPLYNTETTLGTEQQGLLQSQHNNTASRTEHTQHMFHYGNHGPPTSVNIHSEYDYYADRRNNKRKRRNLWTILCYPFACLKNDQLGRSFCFGAIDGMLTGTGLLSACLGLGLLPHRGRLLESPLSTEETMHTQYLLIALTLAACFSDGICMAVGHVWSTRLVAGSTYEERKEEMRNFETSRADAKARLVELLLGRGMLKIDAMNLADTLEGYPEMFISTLLGETLTPTISILGSGGGSANNPSSRPTTTMQRHVKTPHNSMAETYNIPPPSYGPSELHHGLKYESYSDFSDYHQDFDLKTYEDTIYDSRLEGLCMMISFGSFGVVPILIYVFLPRVVDYVTSSRDVNMVLMHDHPPGNVVVVLSSFGVVVVVMFLLGAWKSKFYSSHWCMFGMETIGILILCIATAYSVGLGCGFLINSHCSS